MDTITIEFHKTDDGTAIVATSPTFPTVCAMGADEIDALKAAIDDIRRHCAVRGIKMPRITDVEINFTQRAKYKV